MSRDGHAGVDRPYGPAPRGRYDSVLEVSEVTQTQDNSTDFRYSLDELKSWVARNSSVPLQHIVALTPQGRSVKSATLHAEVSYCASALKQN